MNSLFQKKPADDGSFGSEALSCENQTGERFIVFSLGEELFAISAAKVAEVLQMPFVAPLPNLPGWIVGIANLRSQIITVLDLSKLWSRKTEQSNRAKPKLIVMRGRQNSNPSIAFIADRLTEIINLSAEKIRPAEETPLPLSGEAFHNSKILNLLDTEKLISTLEVLD